MLYDTYYNHLNKLKASLTTISSFHELSQQTSGFLLAIGSSMPEFTTNLISTLEGEEDISLGVGAIAGSGSFGKKKI